MNHQMNIKQTYATGAELWVCPHCTRRMVVKWGPFKRIVLNEGALHIAHSGVKTDEPDLSLEVDRLEIEADKVHC